ncbi:predicted protein [Chaetomium globosum CBS 148.51]|uniref:Uncharacterized protein n=1 Tax=Chaetomium globosum (strain ATCC 6205 / CBS 148.51 / DSM 1962 / NBRC 6347 / NRRL 1970) TaxID=306901 RepID=Q2H9H8_CHAGB|nr:uncharacterized protein CHGG_03126 [Chaetomium globosum CBS 148.51]EAQ91191.1 predicted protein [Chaetomium globosum CBS 148.51]
MAEVDFQPQIVLRCPQCNKPFDKPRPSKSVGKGASNKEGVDAPATEPSRTIRSPPFDSPHDIGHHTLQDELVTQIPTALANSGDEWFDWNNPIFDFVDPTSSWQTKGDMVQFSPPLTRTPVHEATPSALQNFLRQQTFLSSYMSIPRQPHDILGSLAHRPTMGPKTKRTATLILQTLKSYPLILLQQDSLPPFIHPRMMVSAGAESDSMEPLNNCISLLHMTRAGVPGNRKLFWRNVRMECERFYQEL